MNSKTREMLDAAVRLLDSPVRMMKTEDVVMSIYNLGRIDEALILGNAEYALDLEMAQQGTIQ